MICQKCGKENPENTKICQNCQNWLQEKDIASNNIARPVENRFFTPSEIKKYFIIGNILNFLIFIILILFRLYVNSIIPLLGMSLVIYLGIKIAERGNIKFFVWIMMFIYVCIFTPLIYYGMIGTVGNALDNADQGGYVYLAFLVLIFILDFVMTIITSVLINNEMKKMQS